MRALALVDALLSVPTYAANYTPWPGAGDRTAMSEAMELAQGKSSCKHCTKGQWQRRLHMTALVALVA